MIDLHVHSVFSDGELIPAEIIRRMAVAGCEGLAITDHADPSNIELIVPRVSRACRDIGKLFGVKAVAGVELTHIPPGLLEPLVKKARRVGAAVVIVHGETLAEPVAEGTNRAAIEAGADVLAHPGLITDAEAVLAAETGVLLEISARKGHCLTNGHVVAAARRAGASLVINSDAHSPGDFMTPEMQRKTGLGAGMAEKEIATALENARALIEKAEGVGKAG